MINAAKFRIMDICGITSQGPLQVGIKDFTWARDMHFWQPTYWKTVLSQSLASHIALIATEHSLNYTIEMEGDGIEENYIHEWDHGLSGPQDHITFVGRHKAFYNPNLAAAANAYLLDLHARHVKYGFTHIVNFVADTLGIHLHDKDNRLICSELPRVIFKQFKIIYPPAWDNLCSPMSWQIWQDPDFTIIPASEFYK